MVTGAVTKVRTRTRKNSGCSVLNEPVVLRCANYYHESETNVWGTTPHHFNLLFALINQRPSMDSSKRPTQQILDQTQQPETGSIRNSSIPREPVCNIQHFFGPWGKKSFILHRNASSCPSDHLTSLFGYVSTLWWLCPTKWPEPEILIILNNILMFWWVKIKVFIKHF